MGSRAVRSQDSQTWEPGPACRRPGHRYPRHAGGRGHSYRGIHGNLKINTTCCRRRLLLPGYRRGGQPVPEHCCQVQKKMPAEGLDHQKKILVEKPDHCY
jgi:hypothetical protein